MHKAIMMAVAALAVASTSRAVDLKEDAAIKAQFEKLQKAFNAADAKGVAALFADDGDLINPAGQYAKGKLEIEKLAAQDLANIIAGGTSTFTIRDWRFIGNSKDTVLVNATHDFKGGKGPMPEGQVLVTTVMVRRAGQWMVIAARPMVPVKPPSSGAAPAAPGTTKADPTPATPATPAVPAGAAAPAPAPAATPAASAPAAPATPVTPAAAATAPATPATPAVPATK